MDIAYRLACVLNRPSGNGLPNIADCPGASCDLDTNLNDTSISTDPDACSSVGPTKYSSVCTVSERSFPINL
jgi:hypothetical protein